MQLDVSQWSAWAQGQVAARDLARVRTHVGQDHRAARCDAMRGPSGWMKADWKCVKGSLEGIAEHDVAREGMVGGGGGGVQEGVSRC